MPIARESRHASQQAGSAISTNVSEATRRYARPAGHEVEAIVQEYDRLIDEKRAIEGELANYSQTRMLKEQAEIRKQSGNTLQKWLKRKTELEDERAGLVSRKVKIETRLMHIKIKAKAGKQLLSADDNDRLRPVMLEVLATLKRIEGLLASHFKEPPDA